MRKLLFVAITSMLALQPVALFAKPSQKVCLRLRAAYDRCAEKQLQAPKVLGCAPQLAALKKNCG